MTKDSWEFVQPYAFSIGQISNVYHYLLKVNLLRPKEVKATGFSNNVYKFQFLFYIINKILTFALRKTQK